MAKIYSALRYMLTPQEGGNVLTSSAEDLIKDLKPGPEIISYQGNLQAASTAVLETECVSQELIDLVLEKYFDAIGGYTSESPVICGTKYSEADRHRMLVYGMSRHGVVERLWLCRQFEWIKKFSKWVYDEDERHGRHTDGSANLAYLFAKYADWDQRPQDFHVTRFVKSNLNKKNCHCEYHWPEIKRIEHGVFKSKTCFKQWANENGLNITPVNPHNPAACLWDLPKNLVPKRQ
ncbi:MAG: hypothetical protein A3C08_00355 [Candidatus Taylorbacteria bacterium RIFCSPHIGHO2_02_FULL_47_18]|uniref:Uncharacterized protein n=1 Tax=Candidatus Taylorbacteria bacterium RIFCSPLOWO2_01_FULL_48_100 TaxID=1802322 RepID=A0A1G2NCT7_9BACT|nr:MAG: hypothetical protein A2670_00070 [Candidatus Taylorbacteria bacterium RIFCSPHIGHO2_01_FULL_48_38]OHA27813.1 MAG: hypothetical protein A3C08_00355 [Candidatus Taylorbacteria bacterium RIFCSPHIGHO2_02_FULL_47_18]OHA33925.1 MAG: hypothetical protein A2938_02795 [Candidatus Taylorbacteria bacterium RIFCSPLOWO2_01_FULL_48_100]OHA40899.1 MAG: hypothetical protein A3J31_03800 [Candidatus Taylorbacteria bacterium RIFCSPLOWO2_02_FULL_48_16]OHA45089.1 MAG: hypothetical protein A3H13_02775 [Candid